MAILGSSAGELTVNGSVLHGAKAWINFDGTLVTATADLTGVKESFNIASVVDNGTGDYTINFTNAMVDSNYVVIGTALSTTETTVDTILAIKGVYNTGATTKTTSAVRIIIAGASITRDHADVNVSVFR